MRPIKSSGGRRWCIEDITFRTLAVLGSVWREPVNRLGKHAARISFTGTLRIVIASRIAVFLPLPAISDSGSASQSALCAEPPAFLSRPGGVILLYPPLTRRSAP